MWLLVVSVAMLLLLSPVLLLDTSLLSLMPVRSRPPNRYFCYFSCRCIFIIVLPFFSLFISYGRDSCPYCFVHLFVLSFQCCHYLSDFFSSHCVMLSLFHDSNHSLVKSSSTVGRRSKRVFLFST